MRGASYTFRLSNSRGGEVTEVYVFRDDPQAVRHGRGLLRRATEVAVARGRGPALSWLGLWRPGPRGHPEWRVASSAFEWS